MFFSGVKATVINVMFCSLNSGNSVLKSQITGSDFQKSNGKLMRLQTSKGRDTSMSTKCANPGCSEEFQYLHQGKVFVLGSNRRENLISSRVNFAGCLDYLQYVWLCDKCAQRFDCVLDDETRIKIRARRKFSGLIVALVSAMGFRLIPALDLFSDLWELVA